VKMHKRATKKLGILMIKWQFVGKSYRQSCGIIPLNFGILCFTI